MSQDLYLNNSGTRWVIPSRMKFRLIDEKENYNKVRKAICYESFGNFAVVVFKYKGKRKQVSYVTVKAFAEDFEKDAKGLSIVKIKN